MGVARDQSVAGGYRPVLGCSRTQDSVVDFSRAETPGASKHLEYAVATPTESGVLSRLSFLGGMGHAARLAARRIPCFEHPATTVLQNAVGGFQVSIRSLFYAKLCAVLSAGQP